MSPLVSLPSLSPETRAKVPRLKLLGTPVHPTLAYIPATMLSIGPAFDLAARVTGAKTLAQVGYANQLVGAVSALPTASTGLLDWLRVGPKEPGKALGLWHMGLNVVAVGTSAGSLWARRKRPSKPNTTSLVLGGLTAGIVSVSGHLGGLLVYQKGLRVERSNPLEHVAGEESPEASASEPRPPAVPAGEAAPPPGQV